jgi:hypothetical protein
MLPEIEIWSPVPEYEGIYDVSNYGRVKSLCRVVKFGNRCPRVVDEKILKRNNSNGYLTISLARDGKKLTAMIHSLVAKAFINNPDSKPHVNHKDGIRWNNFYKNLEWVTCSENVLHSYNVLGNTAVCGSFNGSSKLNECDISRIISLYNNGLTQKEIGKMYNVSMSNISKIIRGETWSHAI